MSKFSRIIVIGALSLVEAGFCMALADAYLSSTARANSLELSSTSR